MRRAARFAALALLLVSVLPFVSHSALRGMQGLSDTPEALERLAGGAISNEAIFTHMILGAAVTVLAVVQWAGPCPWPRLHRISGRALVAAALLTAVGGLIYIALRRTVGGPWMSAAFGLYGALMAIAAVKTLRFARAGRFARHRRWGLRLIVLALGSWLYRVHYGLLYGISCSIAKAYCGAGSNEAFTGLFDRLNLFGFYLPYLALLELWLRTKDAGSSNKALGTGPTSV